MSISDSRGFTGSGLSEQVFGLGGKAVTMSNNNTNRDCSEYSSYQLGCKHQLANFNKLKGISHFLKTIEPDLLILTEHELTKESLEYTKLQENKLFGSFTKHHNSKGGMRKITLQIK